MSPLTRLAALLIVLLPLAAVSQMPGIEGRWLSGDGDGWIEITLVGDSLSGRIAGSPNDQPGDAPRYDDPNSGKTYKGTIQLVDADTLKLRGYVGIPLFGRTETRTRDDG